MNHRIIGLDLARVFSIFGMMVVNYHFGFGAFEGNKILLEIANFFSGRASATFVILAGMGLILFAKKTRSNPNDKDLVSNSRRTILIRSLLLFVIGTIDSIYWPADILRSYGVFFFIGAFCLHWKKNHYLYASLFSIFVFTLLFILFDFSKDWNFMKYSYIGFWTIPGFLKSLFFNGWNPIFPWIGLFFWGMYLGVYLIEENQNQKKVFWMSGVILLILFLISLNSDLLKILNPVVLNGSYAKSNIFTVNQLPPLPLYFFMSICFANLVIIIMNSIGDRFQSSTVVNNIAKIGTYSHTIYLFHIYFGIILYILIRGIPTEEEFYSVYGTESIGFMWIYTICAFLILSIYSLLWSRKFQSGPLETLVKKLSDNNRIKKEKLI